MLPLFAPALAEDLRRHQLFWTGSITHPYSCGQWQSGLKPFSARLLLRECFVIRAVLGIFCWKFCDFLIFAWFFFSWRLREFSNRLWDVRYGKHSAINCKQKKQPARHKIYVPLCINIPPPYYLAQMLISIFCENFRKRIIMIKFCKFYTNSVALTYKYKEWNLVFVSNLFSYMGFKF